MAGKNDLLNSTIGDGSVFEGKFYISGSVKIDGKFEGEIRTDEELVVGETGKVRTNINAKSVVVAGVVIGNITATERITLLSTAKVLGNIKAPVLSIEPGVLLKGSVMLTSKNAVDVQKNIESSYDNKQVTKTPAGK